MARKVASSKTAFDAHGKELKEQYTVITSKIDADRKLFRDQCDALRDEIRKPLTDWENLEKQRVVDIEQALIREEQLKRQVEIGKALAKERAEAQARQAEIDRQKAIEDERKRIEMEQLVKDEAERKAQEAREADKAHKKKVCDSILAEFAKLNIDEKTGKDLIKAIYNNQIPNITIKF